jgi:predicted dehydrogenase
MRLSVVVSSKPELVQREWPQSRVVSAAAQAFNDPQVDLVVIATGNESHFPLAKAALLADKHVVVDKPCTVTLAQTEELLALAKARGRVLTVFQNRRWDADFRSLQEVINSGVLGRVVHFESHFDRYRPVVPDRWREKDLPGSGLWFDLGPHLVDQCLQLFGAPQDVMLDTACQRDGAQVNDYFHATLRYGSLYPGLRVLLHGSALVPRVGPRFVLHGTLGSFVKYGLDVQEDALKAGVRPLLGSEELSGWGLDPQPGRLTVYGLEGPVQSSAPNVPGNYLRFYAQLGAYLQGQAPAPAVTTQQIHQTMAVLTTGERSALEGKWLSIS